MNLIRSAVSKLIIVASMLGAIGVAAGTMRFTAGNDTVRLFDTPCVELAVLAHIAPRYQAEMRKAEVTVGGQSLSACWIVDGESARLMYADGDQGLIRLTSFRPDEGT
jgi:hypothetical protein